MAIVTSKLREEEAAHPKSFLLPYLSLPPFPVIFGLGEVKMKQTLRRCRKRDRGKPIIKLLQAAFPSQDLNQYV